MLRFVLTQLLLVKMTQFGISVWTVASFLMVLVTLASADAVKTKSDNSALKVILPSNLTNTGLKHSQALFGNPSYGGDKTIIGEVYYVTPHPDKTGCHEEEIKSNLPSTSVGVQKIFLMDRGDCDFVEKVRNAQSLGADAVIISDNLCQCEQNWNDVTKGRTSAVKQRCRELAEIARKAGKYRGTGDCAAALPYMADDGRGRDITIPSFLIDFVDAQPLKDCFQSARNDTWSSISGIKCEPLTKLILSLQWDIPTTDKVSWKLWSSSDSEAMFKKEFAESSQLIAEKAVFTPRYFIWNGVDWGCTVGEACVTQCTEGGYYCNPDPDDNLFEGVSGRDVVEENLRQICIWEQAQKSGKEVLWWEYVAKFADDCHKSKISAATFNEKCSEEVQRKIAGLSVDANKACVEESWNGTRNSKLDVELNDRIDLNIMRLPSAMVNGVILSGGVTPFNVLSAICAGYAAGSAPALCKCVDRDRADNVLECINLKCKGNEKYCPNTGKCIPDGESCCALASESYCSSLNQCLPSKVSCPSCPADKPIWCVQAKTCVNNVMACSDESGGASASTVFFITVIVTTIVGGGLFVFWRRQRAKLHDDVRAILSSYMALGENEDSELGSRVSRQPRRVEPDETTPVGGQDAAQYI